MVWMSCTAIGSTPAKVVEHHELRAGHEGAVISSAGARRRRVSTPVVAQMLDAQLVEQLVEAGAAFAPPSGHISRMARSSPRRSNLRKIDGSWENSRCLALHAGTSHLRDVLAVELNRSFHGGIRPTIM